MSEIKVLNIVDGENTIFSQGSDQYIIPLYQRAFAWGNDEICQLIDDIYDFDADHYYLGSLIVHVNKDGKFEVIDGQQRLTALYLLLNYLGYSWGKDRLSFECRERSNYTLNYLLDKTGDNLFVNTDDEDKIEESLREGKKHIIAKFSVKEKGNVIDKDTFREKLNKVKLFRIEVPKHTDLNRYFEIMNVRGEQLEQHDILKAKLMEPLKGDKIKQKAFAIVWDACREMNCYIQMRFSPRQREALFGEEWNSSPDFNKLCELLGKNPTDEQSDMIDEQSDTTDESTTKLSAIEISKRQSLEQKYEGVVKEGKNVRFESIISFPYFLLHTLKVLVDDNKELSLDDKKLVKTFDDVIKNKYNEDKESFSLQFIECLLKCRFLFDKYVIKREYLSDDKDGKWSLKELCVSNSKSKKSAYYNDTTFDGLSFDDNLKLQSCMRVSYTSAKVMHWITQYLKCLCSDGSKLSNAKDSIESIAKEEVKKFVQEKDYMQGVGAPHIIFNYLDYLLWKERNNNEKYKSLDFGNFVFEFRNSVEHWYPQHPSGGSCAPWEDKENGKYLRDSFGNLCIVSREINSRFSNASPVSKKTNDAAKNGSLKLRLMSAWTTSDDIWRNDGYKKHQEEMINLLKFNMD